MKMNNENLIKRKIEILSTFIQPNRTYQDIALLIDKPDYLSEVVNLRNELDIKIPKFTDDKAQLEFIVKHSNGLFLTKRYEEFIGENSKQKDYLENIIIEILNKFKYPFSFRDIVLQSLFYGFILLPPSVLQVIPKNYKFWQPTLAIIPTPATTKEELLKAFKSLKSIYKSKAVRKITKHEETMGIGPYPDYFPRIRAFRCWYWEHLTGKKYPKIANEWMDNPMVEENDSGADENVVLKGIQTYRRLLEL